MTYQVPKISVEVTVVLSDGSELDGSIFISENLLSYTGTPRLEDFLNQKEEGFFPFHEEDGGYMLLNKNRLIYLRSSEDDHRVLEEKLMLKPQKVTVRFTNGRELEGVVYSTLPKESLRVSDFFNQRETFLPMYADYGKVILNSDLVVWTRDEA